MNKTLILIVGLLVGLGVTGFVVYRVVANQFKPVTKPSTNTQQGIDENLPANTEIEVTVEKSTQKENTIVVKATKLNGKYTGIDYEVTYETQGTFQGVNSGSKPIDVSGKDDFLREVYLGTCSKNVCKPHPGVTKVAVTLALTDSDGNRSQFSKDYPL